MLLSNIETVHGNVDPDDTQEQEGKVLHTISEEQNVPPAQVSNDNERLSDALSTHSNERYSDSGTRNNDINFSTSRSMNSSVHSSTSSRSTNHSVRSSTSQTSRSNNVNTTVITLGSIALGISEATGLSSFGTRTSILLGTGAIFATLPGYLASMLAHVRTTSENQESEAESRKGVTDVLEMIGLMVEEADELTNALKVDKISALVTISTPRMKKKMEETEIEEDRLGQLLVGFEVFREYYFKQEHKEFKEDGSVSMGNSFEMKSYNSSVHRLLMREAGVTESSYSIAPKALFGEMSSIRKYDSASISQIPPKNRKKQLEPMIIY